jgi:hypothetical protein
MKNRTVFLSTAAAIEFGLAAKAQAVCPVCTVAVSTGLGLSRWLGVDDTVTGLWLGGVTVSLIIWSISWMEKRNIHFKGQGLITTVFYYLLLFLPLYLAGIAGQPRNTLGGIDKLVLGTAAGSAAFYSGAWLYKRLKEKNNGRSYFPFQKVVMPIAPLVILSIIFYFSLRQA